MKYLVELKFTNPSHEHVSLRRRVESVTRLVEAANEDQAILRASQQQRALGFFIKEAKVVKEKSHDKEGADETMVAKGKEVMKKAEGKDEEDEEKAEDIEEAKGTASYPLLKKGEKLKPMKLKMGEGFDPEPSDIAAHLVKKHGKGKVTKDHVDAYEKDRDSNRAIDKEAVMKHVQKMSEEVALDEMDKSQPSSSRGAEGLALGKKADPVKTDKVKLDALKLLQKQYKKVKEEVESVNEDQAADMQKIQSMDKGSMVGGKTELKTHLKYLNAMHTHQKKYGLDTAKTKKKIGDVSRSLVQMGEEVEQIDEANMRFDPEAAARPKSSDVKNFLNRDKNARAAAASKKYIRRMTKLGGLGPNQTKKDTEAHMKAHFEEVVTEASKEGKDVMRGMRASLKSMDLRHGVDSDKREAGYKMSPAVRAAQTKSDALSKPEKKTQAGTLGAHKARKAAERMVYAAKKKVNKINMNPSMEQNKNA